MNSVILDIKVIKTIEIINFLDKVPLFSKLTYKDARILAKYLYINECNPGEILFNEGDKGDYVCFVVKGILEILKKSKISNDVVITTVGRGRSIGEMSVIDDYSRSATVQARTEAVLIILTRERFDKILTEHPLIGIKVLKGITRLISLNLRKTSGNLVDCMMAVI